jgi:S1-C subfamily serine protease
VAGKAVASTSELLPAVAALPPASRARIGVQRGKERLEVELVIGERPPLRQQR